MLYKMCFERIKRVNPVFFMLIEKRLVERCVQNEKFCGTCKE